MHRIFNHRPYWIALFLVLGGFSAWQASYIGFVYDLEQFFPTDDEDVKYLQRFHEELERDDLFVLVAFERQPNIYDSSFLNKVHAYTLRIRQHPHVARAEGLTTYREPSKTPFGWRFTPVIQISRPNSYGDDSARIASNETVFRQFVSEKHDALSVSIKTSHQLSQTQTEALQQHLDSLALAFDLHESVHYGGVITTQSVFVQKIKSELLLFISLSVVLVTIVLWMLYRTFWGVVIPLTTVVLALLIFLGFLGVTRQDFNIMSTMFPTLMLIFGMSDIIHLQSKYVDALHKGLSKREAMLLSLKEIGLALWLTSLTTAIGFASLLTSSTPAIQQFGLNAATGVFIAFVVVLVFGSSCLAFFGFHQLQRSTEGAHRWEKLSTWLFIVNQRYPRRILVVSLLIVLMSLISLPYISTNSYLLGDIPERSRLRDDFKFFESAFSGVRPFEMAIEPKQQRGIFDPEVLEESIKLNEYLEKTHQIQSLYSPATLVRKMHQAEMQDASVKLPTDANDLASLVQNIRRAESKLFFKLWNDAGDYGRLSGRIRDAGSDSLGMQLASIKAWIKANIRTDVVDFRPTGSVLLVDKNHAYLRSNLFYSLGFAFILVALIFAWLFKDWRMVLVSIIPNILPMLIAGAALSVTGIELKAVTSVIFTVSFGIAVDDTIHFLTRYKLQRKRGDNVEEALKETFIVSAKAITMTTILLVVGFISLVFSSFTGTYYVGILICVTLVSAWLADVFIIPQLIYLINPNSRSASSVDVQRN